MIQPIESLKLPESEECTFDLNFKTFDLRVNQSFIDIALEDQKTNYVNQDDDYKLKNFINLSISL